MDHRTPNVKKLLLGAIAVWWTLIRQMDRGASVTCSDDGASVQAEDLYPEGMELNECRLEGRQCNLCAMIGGARLAVDQNEAMGPKILRFETGEKVKTFFRLIQFVELGARSKHGFFDLEGKR